MEVAIVFPILAWGVFVGVVFSAIGAAGGILTSFGLITLFGVLDPNSVKPMTQIVVLITVLVFIPGYLRRKAMVFSLGLILGAGGLFGAYLGSTLSSRYLSDMATFVPVFGVLTLAIAAQITWKLLKRSGDSKCVAVDSGVSQTRLTAWALHFRYGDRDFHVPLWSPLLAGFLISMVAAIFGVGGGFLLVPYMASVLAMPMHIIPATTAIAIFMSLAVSISNFIALGAPVQYDLLIPLAAGSLVGAVLGPVLNRRMDNRWLHGTLALIITAIGLKYLLF